MTGNPPILSRKTPVDIETAADLALIKKRRAEAGEPWEKVKKDFGLQRRDNAKGSRKDVYRKR